MLSTCRQLRLRTSSHVCSACRRHWLMFSTQPRLQSRDNADSPNHVRPDNQPPETGANSIQHFLHSTSIPSKVQANSTNFDFAKRDELKALRVFSPSQEVYSWDEISKSIIEPQAASDGTPNPSGQSAKQMKDGSLNSALGVSRAKNRQFEGNPTNKASRRSRTRARLVGKTAHSPISDQVQSPRTKETPSSTTRSVNSTQSMASSLRKDLREKESEADAQAVVMMRKTRSWQRLLVRQMVEQDSRTINSKQGQIQSINMEQPPIPRLAHNLDRVLFNPGVYQLRDPYSLVYNFDPYLEKVMPVEEFDFSALKEYKTSSEDKVLFDIAKSRGKKFVGSTSSMTAVLGQFHHLLSRWRGINLNMLSRSFHPESIKFTRIASAPASIFLRWNNGTYAIDADKEYDTPNILMLLGKSMEKLLSMSKSEFERFRKSNPEQVPSSERLAAEPFQYTQSGDMLMRSQLDTFDPRLPNNGTFDLKTRTVISIRMDHASEEARGYEIMGLHGQFMSYEREYYDMLRATMLKYMLQVRMGRMEGIFVAYHNIERIFGFQYISLKEIDRALHGQLNTGLGDAEFNISLAMLNDILNKATAKFPEQSLRILFETIGSSPNSAMKIFAEPIAEDKIRAIQDASKQRAAEYERKILYSETHEDAVKASGLSSSAAQAPAKTDALPAEDIGQNGSTEQTALPDPNESGQGIQGESLAMLLERPRKKKPRPSGVVGNAKGPLYAALLTFESTMSGQPVVRPEKYSSPAIDWKVDYKVHEYPESQLDRSWVSYDHSRERRKSIFTEQASADDGDGMPKDTVDYYIRTLRSMAAKGRRFRQAHEKRTANKPVQVWTP